MQFKCSPFYSVHCSLNKIFFVPSSHLLPICDVSIIIFPARLKHLPSNVSWVKGLIVLQTSMFFSQCCLHMRMFVSLLFLFTDWVASGRWELWLSLFSLMVLWISALVLETALYSLSRLYVFYSLAWIYTPKVSVLMRF